jgi:Uncharacterized conserved protein
MNRNLQSRAENIVDTQDVEKIKEASAEIAEDIKELGNAVRDLASDGLHKVQQKASKLYSRSQDGVKSVERRLEQKVRSKPIQAILIAAGIGFVLGWLRKKSD